MSDLSDSSSTKDARGPVLTVLAATAAAAIFVAAVARALVARGACGAPPGTNVTTQEPS